MQKNIRLLLLFGLLVLAFAACSSDEEPEEKTKPTPELAVVVFATEDPNAEDPTPTATATVAVQNTPTVTATSGATAGSGISGNVPVEQTPVVNAADFEKYVENRPDDINPLTGLKVDDPALLDRRPLMVRVGNDPGARPQVGLNEADIVYEEMTEWWITRFTAIFLGQDPEMIAPIRSARLINLQLVPQYQGALSNSGGSDGVRWELSQSDIVNLDEYFVPAPYFYRENEDWQTRLAFDATTARDYLADEGLDTDVGLRGFYFADQIDEKSLPAGVLSNAQEVIVPFPKTTSEATWKYDPATGKYLRFTTGDPHNDFEGNQLAASNVMIYFADHQDTDIVEDSNGATSIRINVNGRGAAWLLRDGKILKGNWKTDGDNTPMFVFDNDQPMPLKPGNTWVQVIPLEYTVNVDGTEYSSLPEWASPQAEETPAGVSNNTPTPEAPTTPTPTLTPIGARPSTGG